jgi:hypothetical protein
MGDRGAQFVAHNLKNLTVFSICKQWSDSDNNHIEDEGAIAIAKGLKNLKRLYICK